MSKSAIAAGIVFDELSKKNHRDHVDLKTVLNRYGLASYYLPKGIREIRDLFGDNALAVIQDGKRRLYVLDPEVSEGKEYAQVTAKRALTESEHLQHVLNWLAAQYGNRGFIRNSRRYARNLVEELRELVVATNGTES